MAFQLSPVGTPANILDAQVSDIVTLWKNEIVNSKPWTNSIGKWSVVSNYIVNAADFFIRSIDDLDMAGADKKATVLEALNTIYDSIVPGLLPFFIKPFNYFIKSFFFDVIIPLSIDFFVKKYHAADWVAPTEPEAPTV